MNRSLTLVCALAFTHGAALAADPLPRGDPAKAGFSPTALQRIDRFFEDEIARNRIPGGVVVRRGLRSREGHKILIDDDAQRRCASGITIGNADDTVSVHLDDLAKELSVTCSATTPAATIRIKQDGSGGGIVIEQSGTGGSIAIKSAGDVTVEAAAPGRLVLKGGAGVKIDGGSGMVELSGSMVKLN